MSSRATAARCRLQAQSCALQQFLVACGSCCRWLLSRKLCGTTLSLKLKPNDCAETLMRRVRLCYICSSRRVTCSGCLCSFGRANPAAHVWAACWLRCKVQHNQVWVSESGCKRKRSQASWRDAF